MGASISALALLQAQRLATGNDMELVLKENGNLPERWAKDKTRMFTANMRGDA